jgi:GT2 family glycosyltransferase
VAPSVTIGFVPRERFALAAESLATLVATTPPHHRLVVVDAGGPPAVLAEVEAVLAGHPHAEVVSTGRPLLPAASKNLVVERASTDYVALVENDVLYPVGWLDGLLAACEEAPADVAAPLIREGRRPIPHFDALLGTIAESAEHPGKVEVRPLAEPRHTVATRAPVQFVEQHCLLFRRAALERIGPFDEQLNTRDEVDLSLALWHAGLTIVLEPAVQVDYIPPTFEVRDDELAFYRQRWDLDRARVSRDRIRVRWNLVDTPGDLGFVRYRNRIPQVREVRRRLAVVAAGNPVANVALLDNGEWFGTEVTEGLAVRPFPELGGYYGGFPAGDAAALAELDRAVAEGVDHVAVGWPAWWWLDHLPALRDRLAHHPDVAPTDDLLRVVDLRTTR